MINVSLPMPVLKIMWLWIGFKSLNTNPKGRLLLLGAFLVPGGTVCHALYVCLALLVRLWEWCCGSSVLLRPWRGPRVLPWRTWLCMLHGTAGTVLLRFSHCTAAAVPMCTVMGRSTLKVPWFFRSVRASPGIVRTDRRHGRCRHAAETGWLLVAPTERGFFGHALIMPVTGRVARTFVMKSCENPRLIITQRDHTGYCTYVAVHTQWQRQVSRWEKRGIGAHAQEQVGAPQVVHGCMPTPTALLVLPTPPAQNCHPEWAPDLPPRGLPSRSYGPSRLTRSARPLELVAERTWRTRGESYRCSDTSGPEAAVPGCSEATYFSGLARATEFPGESAGVRDEPERREKIERGHRSGGGGGGQVRGRGPRGTRANRREEEEVAGSVPRAPTWDSGPPVPAGEPHCRLRSSIGARHAFLASGGGLQILRRLGTWDRGAYEAMGLPGCCAGCIRFGGTRACASQGPFCAVLLLHAGGGGPLRLHWRIRSIGVGCTACRSLRVWLSIQEIFFVRCQKWQRFQSNSGSMSCAV